MIRLISNGVPSKKMTGGKKSSSEGPWNPPSPDPSSVAKGARRATIEDSADSRIGAWLHAAMEGGAH